MKLQITIVLYIFNLCLSRADSPITSTPIYQAYNDIPIIYKASQFDGKMTAEFSKYLSNPNNTIDKKAALINALGFAGGNCGAYYLNFLISKYNYKVNQTHSYDNFFDKIISPHELFCIGYLMMWDSIVPEIVGQMYLTKATNRNPKPYTVGIVWALSYSQIILDKQWDSNPDSTGLKVYPDESWWGNIYLSCAFMENRKDFKHDLRIQAKKIIFYYINGYKEFVDPQTLFSFKSLDYINNLASDQIQLNNKNGVYEIPVRINDSFQFDFIFDTGASDVVLSENVANLLMKIGIISEKDIVGVSNYQLADGSIIQSKNILIKRLDIGYTVVNNVVASIGGKNAPLLLGQSFLEKFDQFNIDNTTGILTIIPKILQK